MAVAAIYCNWASLIDEKVDEGGPLGEDGSFDAALGEMLSSEWALQDELLHSLQIFGHLHRNGHCPTDLVVDLRTRT